MSECNRCKLNGIESVAMEAHLKVTLTPSYIHDLEVRQGIDVLVCLAFELPDPKKHLVFSMKTLDKYCVCDDARM